jgi:hypothetical protein
LIILTFKFHTGILLPPVEEIVDSLTFGDCDKGTETYSIIFENHLAWRSLDCGATFFIFFEELETKFSAPG